MLELLVLGHGTLLEGQPLHELLRLLVMQLVGFSFYALTISWDSARAAVQ
jgi:hypothetical protein